MVSLKEIFFLIIIMEPYSIMFLKQYKIYFIL